MSLNGLLEEGRLHRHSATCAELRDFILKAQRSLHDASQPTISADNRFILAYHGALSAATAVVAAAGYRCTSAGHHQTVFEVVPMVAEEMAEAADFLDACRRRRHQALYGRFGQISAAELAELIETLSEFIESVKSWLNDRRPDLFADAE